MEGLEPEAAHATGPHGAAEPTNAGREGGVGEGVAEAAESFAPNGVEAGVDVGVDGEGKGAEVPRREAAADEGVGAGGEVGDGGEGNVRGVVAAVGDDVAGAEVGDALVVAMGKAHVDAEVRVDGLEEDGRRGGGGEAQGVLRVERVVGGCGVAAGGLGGPAAAEGGALLVLREGLGEGAGRVGEDKEREGVRAGTHVFAGGHDRAGGSRGQACLGEGLRRVNEGCVVHAAPVEGDAFASAVEDVHGKVFLGLFVGVAVCFAGAVLEMPGEEEPHVPAFRHRDHVLRISDE